MKALIAKNEKYETIGVEIYDGNDLVFSWGIAPNIEFNFVTKKDVSIYKVKDLLYYKTLINFLESPFTFRFFEICQSETNPELNKAMNQLKKQERGVNMSIIDDELREYKKQVEIVVKNL